MQDPSKYIKKAELLKALAHPTRLCIVHGLMEGECNVSKMKECLEMPQSTVSQQISILRNKGVIEGKRKGTEVCYSLNNQQIRDLVVLLMSDG